MLVLAESDFPYNLHVPETLLQTKLYIPPLRANVVPRPHLVEQLNRGLQLGHKLTLVSAPAGFGKTTLVCQWVNTHPSNVVWLSLDEGDSDPARFLAYLVAAMQTVFTGLGSGALGLLQSPQPPPFESILTVLLNEIAAAPDNFLLVLDDYHVVDSQPVDRALSFLLEHLPPQMHLVIVTREDPNFPLARFRARGQLTEIRVAGLRFTTAEAAAFLNQVMDLNLSAEDIAALETRTEGWIAGLQLAALAVRGAPAGPGQKDVTGFIKSFTGSHHYVLDYLLEEVLHQQPGSVQAFLLRTSILNRMCGPLCDAVMGNGDWGSGTRDRGPGIGDQPPASGSRSQTILEELERANLFLVPLDDVRRWYRYHHLFADLLRQRLHQAMATSKESVAELHLRASVWYEEAGLDLEAFRHATAAGDIDRAARLVEGEGMPLHFRGPVTPVLSWLASLPTAELDARPVLWVMYASALSMTGRLEGVEEKLQAAEAALEGARLDAKTRNLIGHIAAIRALLAATQYRADAIITESERALEYLHPDNLAVRTATIWKLGLAYHIKGDRVAAGRAYSEAIAICEATGNTIINISSTTGLAQIQESDNQLFLAAESYRRILELVGDSPRPIAGEAYLGLARIYYQWDDLDTAERHGQHSLRLARQIENTDRLVAGELLLACLKLARGDVKGAAVLLDQVEGVVNRFDLAHRIPEVVAARVITSLRQGELAAAAELVEKHQLPLSQARVYLAQGSTAKALATLKAMYRQVKEKNWVDELLKANVLLALAYRAHGETDKAEQALSEALVLAEPGGFIRIFVDEGRPMAQLLYEALPHFLASNYLRRLLEAFPSVEEEQIAPLKPSAPESALIEPLSDREIEVLQLISEGLTNPEIAARLYISVNTVKVHTRNINGKLGVHNRVQAAARGRDLGILPSG